MNLLRERLASALNSEIRTIKALHGGMIGQVYQVRLRDDRTVVAKVAESAIAQLDVEGRMLLYLAEYSGLPVPEVITNEPDCLIMSWIPGNSNLNADVQKDAANHLAALHAVRAPQFGFSFPTLIGGLHQPNPNYDCWIDFFREQRLLYMARVAYDAGQLDGSLYSRIERFAEHLEGYLTEPSAPSLLHGDMWTTNILAQDGRVTGFLDPAIYYGHPEIELAFSTLFNTFGQPYFEQYSQLQPIEDGFFEVRRDIYNLYPLLVHVRLFGGGYSASLSHILSRFGT